MNWTIDTKWWVDNWQTVVIILLLCRSFLNNLLRECPFLKSNKGMELVQGIFNAAVATVVKQPPEEIKKPMSDIQPSPIIVEQKGAPDEKVSSGPLNSAGLV